MYDHLFIHRITRQSFTIVSREADHRQAKRNYIEHHSCRQRETIRSMFMDYICEQSAPIERISVTRRQRHFS